MKFSLIALVSLLILFTSVKGHSYLCHSDDDCPYGISLNNQNSIYK